MLTSTTFGNVEQLSKTCSIPLVMCSGIIFGPNEVIGLNFTYIAKEFLNLVCCHPIHLFC
jgi:hypothetical protein